MSKQLFVPDSFLILVVDDIPNNLKVVSNMLEEEGYGVTFAINGRQALERLKIVSPDLILLDLMMPEMDGLQVCNIIKSDAKYSEIPIIFLTANYEHQNLLKAFDSGAVDYVTKPFNRPELLARVRTHLELKQAKEKLDRLNEVLEQKVQQRTAQLQKALNFEAIAKRIIERVRDSLDESQILATVVQELVICLKLNRCQTGIYDLETATSTIIHEYSLSFPTTMGRVYDFAQFNQIYEELLAGDSVQFRTLPNEQGVQLPEFLSILACPLIDEGETIGDLWLYSLNKETFSDDEIRLVEQIVAGCAISIRQARLYRAARSQVDGLERLNRLKDDFLKTISHELRTPLTNIQMGAETLTMLFQLPNWPQKHFQVAEESLDILKVECQREIKLVNDILDLVHLNARDKAISREQVNLQLLISYIVNLFVEKAKKQEQQLTIDVPKNLPLITTNPDILEKILTELLNNACKYTPIGGKIKVGVESDSQNLKIIVINSGVDVDNIELGRIFDKFYRIPQEDRWQHKGTGLGLALVKKQVEYLGGTIQANNQNQQLSLTVELPLIDNFRF
ncbi:MAG TPA: histidine kinase [Cyanothece sp. UBA12306]|nr:histidine kinase [Cyanothece sp. UBA12306]